MSHFSYPMQLAPDYIPLEQRKIQAIKPVRTNKERKAYSTELGFGVHFFVANRRERRIRMMEILGHGDIRLGYAKLLDHYKKTTVMYFKMFEDMKENNDGHRFSRHINRDKGLMAVSFRNLKDANGIHSYRAMQTARLMMKKYKVYLESMGKRA